MPGGPVPGRVLTMELDDDAPAASAGSRPLEPGVRHQMERAFGTDFSTIRVHQGPQAAEVDAVAYAQGEDLYFTPGTYAPATEAGRELIAHELAHVVQQRSGRVAAPQGQGAPINVDDGLEREADDLAARAVRGEVVAGGSRPGAAGAGAAIQRKPTRWTDIALAVDGKAKWVPHKTQPKTTSDRGEVDATGTRAHVIGTKQADPGWATKLVPKAKIAGVGSGGVTAARLGPDHPRGSEIDASAFAHLKTLDKKAQAAATSAKLGKPSPYVAETVLPIGLGADGSSLDYLVAVPAATGQELRKVHASLMKLVEEQKAWLSFNSWVATTKDGTTSYAKEIRYQWSELDPTGTSVPGTAASIAITAPTPSEHGAATAGTTVDAPAKVGATANKAKTSLANLNRSDDTAVTFQTRIHWSETHGNGDGKLMEANPLGPDHKIGEEPVSGAGHIWNKRTAKLRAAAGKTKADTYVAGHLLNHHVGGPGNDPRNLAAIPSDANKQHLNEVETTIKRLVNDNKAWIYYRVEVTQDHDAGSGVDYADRFICTWHQLDDHGAKLAGTAGARTIKIKAPSDYDTGASYAKDKGSAKGADAAHAKAARSRLAFDELILDDTDTLKHQRAVMAPLVKALQDMELDGNFASGNLKASAELILESFRPKTAEKDALKVIASVSAELQKLAASATAEDVAGVVPVLKGKLVKALDDVSNAMAARHSDAMKAVTVHFGERYLAAKAKRLGDALKTAIGYDSDAFAKLVELARSLVKFAELAVDKLEDHRDHLFEAANKLRGWLGEPDLDPGSSASDVEADITSSVQTGLSNIDDVYNGAPMSPARWQDASEDLVGAKGESSLDSQAMILHYMTQPISGVAVGLDRSKYPSHRGMERMTALLDKHWAHWPKVGTGYVATMVALLAPLWGKDPTNAARALAGYYRDASDEFLEYLEAVEGVV